MMGLWLVVGWDDGQRLSTHEMLGQLTLMRMKEFLYINRERRSRDKVGAPHEKEREGRSTPIKDEHEVLGRICSRVFIVRYRKIGQRLHKGVLWGDRTSL